MKKLLPFIILTASVCFHIYAANPAAAGEKTGAALFRKQCSACHPCATELNTRRSIVDILRNPPSSMPLFDKERLSDEDAKKIEDYILKFKFAKKTNAPAR